MMAEDGHGLWLGFRSNSTDFFRWSSSDSMSIASACDVLEQFPSLDLAELWLGVHSSF